MTLDQAKQFVIEKVGAEMAAAWWVTKNSHLGNYIPRSLVSWGREKEVIAFLQQAKKKDLALSPYCYRRNKISEDPKARYLLQEDAGEGWIRLPRYFLKKANCLSCETSYDSLHQEKAGRVRRILFLCDPCGRGIRYG